MANKFMLAGAMSGALLLSGLYSGIAPADVMQELKPQREAVVLPLQMQEHFFENMRDHLLAVSQIQEALAGGQFDQAAQIARTRLGVDAQSSSACKPGMEHISKLAELMPEGMRSAGLKMHNAADQFASAMKTPDYPSALSSLSKVTQACVACHAAYKIVR